MAEARRDNYLTIEGFTRLMTSEDVHILQKEHCQVYQDMTQPLTSYYISSSHNTYLLSNQIVGQSHLYAYSSALLRGCRCLEIDCWDGEADEPVVYHGYTLINRLSFKAVISVIGQYAFQASPYPLILSLENHCSPRQQEVMAKHLRTILGETLLSMTLCNSFSRVLPSPEALKGKILIKDKKVGLLKDTILRPLPIANGRVAEYKEQGEDYGKEDLKKRRFLAKLLQRSPVSKTKQQKMMMSMQLSDLVIYTKSKKFISFQYSRQNQKFYETNSLSEQEAQKLVQSSAPEFVHHTCRFLTRIYPKGSRTGSSNFCPSEFWNVGCQMVALNFQTPGIAMDLQDGKFLDNGGCGYVLKPEYLLSEESAPQCSTRPLIFTIKVISGFFLPHGSLSKTNTTSLTVMAEIYGGADDGRQKKTTAVKNNSLNPFWNQSLTFSVHLPELALLRVSVEDQYSILPSEFLGQYTLPVTSMSRGYRIIPLLNKYGQSLSPAALFVHVFYQ